MGAVEEVLPGVHRVEVDLGARFLCPWVLRGERRTLLVDTGLAGTPQADLVGALAELDLAPADVDLVLTSHADVDHCGGNAAWRRLAPRSLLACHAADARWVSDPEAMLAENYRWYDGFGPDPAVAAAIRADLGDPAPVDLRLRGGEALDLGGLEAEVLHLPGHTPGHVGLWLAEHSAALVVDAVLGRGVRSRDGALLVPPRIYDVAAYRATIERLRELDPAVLLTAHFPVLRGAEVGAFLDASAGFVDEVEAWVDAQDDVDDLARLTVRADAALGPWPEFTHELAACLRWFVAERTPATA